MSLEHKLKTQVEKNNIELAEKEKQEEIIKNTELHSQVDNLTAENQIWKDNLANLEAKYSEGKISLEVLKSERKKINDIYANPEFADVIGNKSKNEFISENESEEEIKSYRHQEGLVKTEVSALGGLKDFFKDKISDLNFLGGNKEGKSPRQASMEKIEDHISEKDEAIRSLYEQTIEGKKELEQKRKQEVLDYHEDLSKNSYLPDYAKVATWDIEKSQEYGEDLVKNTVVEFNKQKIDAETNEQIKQSGLDKRFEFVEFIDNYQGMSEVREALDDITNNVQKISDKLNNKFVENEELESKFRNYCSGLGIDNLGMGVVNLALRYLESNFDYASLDNISYYKGNLKEIVYNKNSGWVKLMEDGSVRNAYQLDNQNIVDPESVKKKIACAEAGLVELEKIIDENPEQLIADTNRNNRGEKKDKSGINITEIKKLIPEELVKSSSLTSFYVNEEIFDYLKKGGKLSKLENETKDKIQKIVAGKQEKYQTVEKEVESNWSEVLLTNFTYNNRDFIAQLADLKYKKQVASELSSDLSVLNPHMYKDKQVQVYSKNYEYQYYTEKSTYVDPKVMDKYSFVRTQISDLENKKQILEQEISENKKTKRGLFNKKKLEAELIEKQNMYKDIVTKLDATKVNAENIKGEIEYIQKIQDMVNNHLKRVAINLPEGDMTVTEFIDKAKEVLKQTSAEKLSIGDEAKEKEYEELQSRLAEIKSKWNGKRLWNK